MNAIDRFVCPHDVCGFTVNEPCHPHTEVIGAKSETVGRHCWDVHRCVFGHPECWRHIEIGAAASEGTTEGPAS